MFCDQEFIFWTGTVRCTVVHFYIFWPSPCSTSGSLTPGCHFGATGSRDQYQRGFGRQRRSVTRAKVNAVKTVLYIGLRRIYLKENSIPPRTWAPIIQGDCGSPPEVNPGATKRKKSQRSFRNVVGPLLQQLTIPRPLSMHPPFLPLPLDTLLTLVILLGFGKKNLLALR